MLGLSMEYCTERIALKVTYLGVTLYRCLCWKRRLTESVGQQGRNWTKRTGYYYLQAKVRLFKAFFSRPLIGE